MLRALLLGLLAVVPAASCKKGGDAPAAAVGASAGKVVEITGKVSATRDGKTRDLALGAEVFRDDQIATGDESTVTIELVHNGARWAVMANKSSRVDASLAWGLDKQEASKTVEHNSAAAGRNAEKSAADTQSTTAMKDTSQPNAAAEPVAPVAPPPVSSAPAPTGGAPGGAEAKGGKKSAPPPPPPPKVERNRDMEKKSADMEPLSQSAPMSDPTTPTTPTTKNAPAPKDSAPEKAAVVISPTTLAEKQRAALAKCLDAKQQAKLTIKVNGDKTTTSVTGTGITAKAKQCMDAIVQKIEWPSKGTFEVVLKFE